MMPIREAETRVCSVVARKYYGGAFAGTGTARGVEEGRVGPRDGCGRTTAPASIALPP